MDDGPVQVAAADLAIGRPERIHGLSVNPHPIGHTIRGRYEQALGQAWRRLAVHVGR